MAALGGYTRVREIGSGSYGRAILVKDNEGAQFVLKAIDISRMDSKERREAVNEVRVLSSLKHPYVVSYRESFLDGRTLCIVMDYAEAGDLFNRIAKTRKAGQSLGETQIVRWFTQASLALKHLHEKHVLHRDLKSQNLFLTSGGRLRIGDFGIAKVLDSTAAFAKTTIGTPYYLSPEICQERPYSWSSDVWAMGCILFEMAALRVPFDAANLKALVAKITRGPTPALPSRYSPELARLCGDLLQREERRRPTSSDILKYSIVQTEIRHMLKEEQARRGDADAAVGAAPGPNCPNSARGDPSVCGALERCRGSPRCHLQQPDGPSAAVAACGLLLQPGGGHFHNPGGDGRLPLPADGSGSREATPKHGGA